MKKEVLRVENVTLEKNEITYLRDFSFYVLQGEIVGMIGANHHGIEEFIDLICSNTTLKYGRVYLNEKLVNTYMHTTKNENKVFVIGYHRRLIQDLTVADNIFVLRKGFKKYIINRKVLAIQVEQIFRELQLDINPNLLVSQLNAFECCVVELVKAILSGATLIVLNEISKILSSVDLLKFYRLIHYYAEKGFSFLYIASHHEEVFKIATRFALMKDGKIVKILYPSQMDEAHVQPFVKKIEDSNIQLKKDAKIILKYNRVDTEKMHQFSCEIVEGECITFLDCNNTILQEIADIGMAKQTIQGGTISVEGDVRTIKGKTDRDEFEILSIAENPMKTMLFTEMTYMENLCFLVDRKIKKSIIKKSIYKSIRSEYKKELGEDIDAYSIGELSPKSLYNIIYYRILLCKPKAVFILQPFLGADMYLRVHIATLINRLKKEHIAVILLTSHMADVLAVSDRLLVIEDGNLVWEQSEQEKQMILENYYGNRYVKKIELHQ